MTGTLIKKERVMVTAASSNRLQNSGRCPGKDHKYDGLDMTNTWQGARAQVNLTGT